MPKQPRTADRVTPDMDCGDVASPWPGTILEVKPRDGVFVGADGVVTVVANGRVARFIVKTDQGSDA